MALVSPGIEVSIIDQSQYLPAASNSVPLVVIATAQNKVNAAGTGVATATVAANANKLYQVTSQRDLVTLFGNPFFYKTTNGTSIHGYELNEYGLLATYSLLGTTNRAYVLRADVDLASLVGQLARPTGEPADGTYWVDTTNSLWGIYEFNATTNSFVNKTPMVIVDSALMTDYVPSDSIGNVGDYAVIPLQPYDGGVSSGTYFVKNSSNTWVRLGTREWRSSIPAVTATNAPTALTAGDEFILGIDADINGHLEKTITVPASPNNTVQGLVNLINSLKIGDLLATNTGNKISISYGAFGTYKSISLGATGNGTVLADLGIAQGKYYAPELIYGTSAQMPLWTSSQDNPRPTGSVWIKTSKAGSGLNVVLSKYSATTAAYRSVNVPVYTFTFPASADLDSTGGKAIPAGTVFAAAGGYSVEAPVSLYERLVAGPTVVTGTIVNPSITQGLKLYVNVSTAGSATLNNGYVVTMTGTSATTFVTDWLGTNIPNTTAVVTTDGAIQLTHTLGGDIFINDFDTDVGQSNGLVSQLGFHDGSAININKGPMLTYTASVNQSAATGVGTGALFTITNSRGHYIINSVSGGSGYVVGDLLTISGEDLGGTSANDLVVSVQVAPGGALSKVAYYSGYARNNYTTALSNWIPLGYTANEGAPAATPTNGTNWFYSTATQVDIMVQQGGVWKGYKNVNFDSHGHPASQGVNATDPTGVIMSAAAPVAQTDGTALVYGDLWLDTSDLENYPVISRWQLVNGVDEWVLIDKTDQTSSNGLLFADARWAPNGTVDAVSDPIPSISSLLYSNYLDLDAPSASLYPQGMLLFNTRRSGYNVKQFKTNYFTANKYPDALGVGLPGWTGATGQLPELSYTWVSVSGLAADGSAYMGRKAQRNLVTQSLKAAVSTNMSIREEDTFFNLIATPGYPELQPDMVGLNNERNNTAYIIGDTPLRLKDQATDLVNWATNQKGATASGEDGWVTRDEYLGVFYPSGITSDLTGASVVVPASHMMLRTFLRNDTVAYPWLAAAGTRRGTIDNATNIGYLDGATGEFQTVKNRMSIRDVLYTNQINPMAYFTGVGLLNYGNKNSYDSQSAMDRTNVSRLVAYIRDRLQVAARPFVFEPNDALTRSQLTGVIQSLFIDLVSKRGLYDYLVVCDESNNTPSRIDRSELWVDVAIEPVKAAEFIYIPVRIMNTGALSA